MHSGRHQQVARPSVSYHQHCQHVYIDIQKFCIRERKGIKYEPATRVTGETGVSDRHHRRSCLRTSIRTTPRTSQYGRSCY
jgi:hypothetical protein